MVHVSLHNISFYFLKFIILLIYRNISLIVLCLTKRKVWVILFNFTISRLSS